MNNHLHSNPQILKSRCHEFVKGIAHEEVIVKDKKELYSQPLVLYKRSNPILRRRQQQETDTFAPTQVTLPSNRVDCITLH